jgi:hypothetical protein
MLPNIVRLTLGHRKTELEWLQRLQPQKSKKSVLDFRRSRGFMQDSVAIRAPVYAKAQQQSAALPWYVYSVLVASACAVVGGLWDVSWHSSIGRDTFWTPPHLLTQFCAVLGAITCAILILHTTFGKDDSAQAVSVGLLGFHGPFAAFVVMWGAATMLVSAPFDNWWHKAYGLDVKILSPPHSLLILGVTCVQLGGMLLVLGCRNRAEGSSRSRLDWLFLFAAGLFLSSVLFFSMEYTLRIFMHSAIFYRTVSIGVPIVLIGAAQASDKRWAATTIAGVYTFAWLAVRLILRLFPAEPKLGPVYNTVTHYVGLFFPLLIIGAAICLDLVRPWIRDRQKWLQAAVLGAVFLAVMVAVQWPFGTFLMSPASRNWFFGTAEFSYLWPPESRLVRHLFYAYEPTRAAFTLGMGIALACAIFSARLGLGWAKWMREVRR